MEKKLLQITRGMANFGFYFYVGLAIMATFKNDFNWDYLAGALVFFFVGLLITSRLVRLYPTTPAQTDRELAERKLLLDKVTTQITRALDKQIDTMYIVVVKKMHPTAGVYYDVITRQD